VFLYPGRAVKYANSVTWTLVDVLEIARGGACT
jgi:hypothetical protein